MSLLVTGRLLSDPAGDWRTFLREGVRDIYRPASEAAASALEEVFVRAEAAYFNNVTALNRIGTISLEPLFSDHEGEPIYLQRHMELDGLARYAEELQAVQEKARGLANKVGDRERVERIVHCIDGALRDVAFTARRLGAESPLPPASR